MGQIVAAMATVHAPQLFTRPPSEDLAQLDADIAAMRELGKTLDETKPDALIVIGSDHLETFFLSSVPTFAVMSGEFSHAAFATKEYKLPIHQGLAEDLLDGLIRADFDMSYSQDAELGHAFTAVYEWVLEGRAIPVVPIFVNVYLPPLASARRCEALGKAIAKIIAKRPEGERVAIVASGGMSHYPGTWKYPQPAFDFDHWAIAKMEKGQHDALLDLTVEQLDEVGNTEMLPWMILFGCIGNIPGELLSYQPTWHVAGARGDASSCLIREKSDPPKKVCRRRRLMSSRTPGPMSSISTRRRLPISSTSSYTICVTNSSCVTASSPARRM